MKKKYTEPHLEVVQLNYADIIATSDPVLGIEPDGGSGMVGAPGRLRDFGDFEF